MTPITEFYISVDVETAGPHPARYALLSIGACCVEDPDKTFYVELQPDKPEAVPEALAVSKLSMDSLAANGVPPEEAMRRFAEWVQTQTPAGARPVFVAFNAPFDWMFVADYFHRFLGRNPFGHNALDIKAYHMGLAGVSWADTTLAKVADYHLQACILTHNALDDARAQGGLFRAILSARVVGS
jgi:DNA polymerase III epsilon subunit-like protein